MTTTLAFVLSGGGARGALQAGALRALHEAGLRPDMMVGTSIGAANSAFLAAHGYSAEGIRYLMATWEETTRQDLMPSNFWWQTMRMLFRPGEGLSQRRAVEFAVSHGLTPTLRFGDIQDFKLYLVACDLNAGCPVVFGDNPEDSILEGTLASMTLPPWMAPRVVRDRYLVDGALVSNLPIETAIRQGANEIIALDLFNPGEVDAQARGLRPFLLRLNQTLENRQLILEMQLAEARGVRVHHIPLVMENPTAFWDFRRSRELIEVGYEIMRRAIQGMESPVSFSA